MQPCQEVFTGKIFVELSLHETECSSYAQTSAPRVGSRTLLRTWGCRHDVSA